MNKSIKLIFLSVLIVTLLIGLTIAIYNPIYQYKIDLNKEQIFYTGNYSIIKTDLDEQFNVEINIFDNETQVLIKLYNETLMDENGKEIPLPDIKDIYKTKDHADKKIKDKEINKTLMEQKDKEDKNKGKFKKGDYWMYNLTLQPKIKEEDRYVKIGNNSIYLFAQSEVFTGNLNVNTYTADNLTVLSINKTNLPFNNLVYYLPLDLNCSEIYAYDFSGNGFTVNTENSFYNPSCVYGGCRSFNGINTRIYSTSVPHLSKILNWTAMSWIYMQDNSSYNTFFANTISSSNLMGIQYHSLGKTIVVGVYNGSAYGQYIYKASTGSIPIDIYKWYHLAVSFNSGNISIYLNGVDVTSTSLYTPLMQTVAGFNLGSRTGDYSYALNGSMDEVMIFNSSLNSSQILNIYNNQSQRFVSSGESYLRNINISSGNDLLNTTFGCYQRLFGSNLSLRFGQWDISRGYNNSDFSGLNGLVLLSHLDNESSSVAVDYSSKGNNGTIVGATFISDGKYGNSLSFDGINNYVNFSNILMYNYSVSVWFKTPNANAGFIAGFNTTKADINFQILNSKILIRQATSNYLYSATDVNDNSWHHLVVNYGYNCSNADLYLDGILNEGTSSYVEIPYKINTFVLGANGSRTGNYFNGSLDEVMIFNRTLNLQEIKALYTGGSYYGGPVPNWNYTAYQNITTISGVYPEFIAYNNFSISKNTTIILPVFRLISGINNFYTPILKASQGLTITTYLSRETNPPNINIIYPLNISYNIHISSLNYTYSDDNPGSCWYSINNGTTNSSAVTAGINFTGITSTEGFNTWHLYCNDSYNNINKTFVIFFKDTSVSGEPSNPVAIISGGGITTYNVINGTASKDFNLLTVYSNNDFSTEKENIIYIETYNTTNNFVDVEKLQAYSLYGNVTYNIKRTNIGKYELIYIIHDEQTKEVKFNILAESNNKQLTKDIIISKSSYEFNIKEKTLIVISNIENFFKNNFLIAAIIGVILLLTVLTFAIIRSK